MALCHIKAQKYVIGEVVVTFFRKLLLEFIAVLFVTRL